MHLHASSSLIGGRATWVVLVAWVVVTPAVCRLRLILDIA